MSAFVRIQEKLSKAQKSKMVRPAIKKRMKFVKNAVEIRCLTEAARVTKDIFTVISKRIKPGVSESEIAREIENLIKIRGLKPSFKTIVASGPNAAKPHAKVTRRIIKNNDAVVIDFGVIYKGYHSDMTRTIMFGKASPAIRGLYKTVKFAQGLAIRRAAPGLKISDFTSGVYNYIRKKNLGKFILHRLGHGIGTRIHEPPGLSEKNRNILKEGMVITIEPGLYIKGRGGVRIEDMVRVRKKGVEVLTR